MAKKLKKYVIFVSRTYPTYHSKKGQPTNFIEKIFVGQNKIIPCEFCMRNNFCKGEHCLVESMNFTSKIHTFRSNYLLWKKRIDEVLAGNAVIVLKYHTLGRYVKGNEQIEFARLDKDSGIGVQEAIYESDFEIPFNGMAIRCDDGIFRDFPFYKTAENDGLTQRDFSVWFEKGEYDLTEQMACIHFTSFRYGAALHS